MLTGIPRLGPKNAMRIISFAPAARIIQAILAEDEKFLKGIPGIGPKVAKRLIVELPEKVRAITREEDVEYEDVFDEVVEVLTGLGCSPEESGRLINEVKKSAKKKDMGFDELLAESLRIMAREEAGL
jgi:Holliday junction DNA helicase RuvA